MRTSLLILAVCSISACEKSPPRYGPTYTLSDDDLVAYMREASEQSFRGPDGAIGVHRGIKVLADFHEFDDGTPAVIVHYDVPVGRRCEKVGGAVRREFAPSAITAVEKAFCVPPVLATPNTRPTE